MRHCDSKGKMLSFVGVNAHDHQNSIAKKRIQDLQDTSRTMLVHAKQQWPNKAVTQHLWPYYALHTANDIHQATAGKEEASPLEKFLAIPIHQAPRLITSNHLDVQCMSYKDRYKLDKRVLSGTKNRQEWGYILDHPPLYMPDPLHWYSMSLLDWHLPSSTVSLAIYLRRLLTFLIQSNGRNRHTLSSKHLRKLPRKFLKH